MSYPNPPYPQYPYPTPQYGPPLGDLYVAVARKTDGFAIGSLVTGILCLPPVAIVLGIVGLIRTKDESFGGRGMAIAGLVLGIVGLLPAVFVLLVMFPAIKSAGTVADRAACSENLRSIGLALAAYASENSGELPDTLPPPIENHRGAVQCSYVYLGKGVKNTAAPNLVVAYEKAGNHGKEGMNVLFLDGSVQWIAPPTAQKVVKELGAGMNPPPALAYRKY